MQRNKIYKTTNWKEVREQVLKLDNYECTRCNHKIFESNEPKKFTKAYLVHHRYNAKEFPQYVYSIYVNGERNLVSLCFDCHEQIHGRIFNDNAKKIREEKALTEERFD